MKNYVLALDQGTTSSRAVLVDREGRICGIEQQEFPQLYPQPGWVEHDPRAIWESQLAVARQVFKNAHISAGDIAAIGITNQRETTLVWDRRTGEPLANAIVWQDRRTADMCEALRDQGYETWIRERTGLVLDPYFSATKLHWLLERIPQGRSRAERGEIAFGTVDSWLTFKLCGEHVCDASNASRTLLYDIHRHCWDDELLELFGIPRAMLPRVVPSSGVVGLASPGWLGAAIPIGCLAGDQQAATFGQVCVRPGMAKNTYGTGCFMLMNTGERPVASANKLLTTLAWTSADKAVPPHYLLEGSVFMGGATVQWLRDGLQIIQSATEVESLATSVKDTDGVVMVPAFAGLGAPHWDADARGLLLGMTRGTTRAHIARAALESIAFQSADVLAAMEADSGIRLSELRVDGGAARNDFLMQFQADVLNVPVVRPLVTETTALGAAYLAGLALGFWRSQEEISSHWQLERRFEPRSRASDRSTWLERWRRAVARSREWATC